MYKLKYEVNKEQKKIVEEYVRAKLEAEKLQKRIDELYQKLSTEFKNRFTESAVLSYKGKPLLFVQKAKIPKLVLPEEIRKQYLVLEDGEKFIIPKKR